MERGLVDDRARPALGDPEPLFEHQDRCSTAVRGQSEVSPVPDMVTSKMSVFTLGGCCGENTQRGVGYGQTTGVVGIRPHSAHEPS